MAAMLSPSLARPPPPLLCAASLYVGDLDHGVSENDLYQALCSASVPIASIHLCRDSASGKSLGYAYFNFMSPLHASKVLSFLNHKKLKGKPMRIMWCQRNPTPRKNGIGNLFVKNLDSSIDGAGLENIFCKFGTVLSCKVMEEDGKSKGFGFVQFESEESAMAAINALHDTMLHGKKLYVSKFVKKNERQAACGETKFTNLYVKNLDQDLTEDVLRVKFSEFGKICSVAIMKDGEGKSKGFGFISFELPEEAKRALEAMDGTQLGSKNIIVGRAQKKAERERLLKHQFEEARKLRIEKFKTSNVYVKNLDSSIDDEKLKEHFSTCGEIISAKVMSHCDGTSKGFGFVCYSNPDDAKKCIAIFNGTKFKGKSLYVATAQYKEDRQTALQIHHAQYPLGGLGSSVCGVVPPGIDTTCYYLPSPTRGRLISSSYPINCQNFSMDMGSCHPPNTLSYGETITNVVILDAVKRILKELNFMAPENQRSLAKTMVHRSNSLPAETSDRRKSLIAESVPGKCNLRLQGR